MTRGPPPDSDRSLRDDRRLADIWSSSELPEAWDVSMRSAVSSYAAPDATSVFAAVASRKCAYLDTAASVADAGAMFRSFVFSSASAAPLTWKTRGLS